MFLVILKHILLNECGCYMHVKQTAMHTLVKNSIINDLLVMIESSLMLFLEMSLSTSKSSATHISI